MYNYTLQGAFCFNNIKKGRMIYNVNKQIIIIVLFAVFVSGVSFAELKPDTNSLIVTELKNNNDSIKTVVDSIGQNINTIKEGNDFYKKQSKYEENILSINNMLLKNNIDIIQKHIESQSALNNTNQATWKGINEKLVGIYQELSRIKNNTSKGVSFYINILISIVVLLVAFTSLCFSLKTWRKSYRPIVSAMLTTIDDRETARYFKLELINTGLIPAKNVKLNASYSDLKKSLEDQVTEPYFNKILKCFDEKTVILSMHQNTPFKCLFGFCSTGSTKFWKYGSTVSVNLTYQDFFNKTYNENLTIKIMDSTNITDQKLYSVINGNRTEVAI